MLEEIQKERRKKLEEYKSAGLNPYPARIKRSLEIRGALEKFNRLEKSKKRIALAGRIRGLRKQGNIIFIDLEDGSGKIQAVVKKDESPDFSLIEATADLDDFLEVEGRIFKTQKGEKSIFGEKTKIIAKSLRPLPSKFYGLADTETRLRERYLDLLFNPELKELFARKSLFWEETRKFLKKNGFLEVETPVLETIPGGADAEPFITRHNALNQDFYLRISLELPLKKLMVAGFEKIYEVGRIFRNEGIDDEHLQDYTQLEFYWAYADYNQMMEFGRKLYQTVIKNTFGVLVLPWKNKKISWGGKWPVLQYIELMKGATGFDPRQKGRDKLESFAKKHLGEIQPNMGKGKLIDLIFKKLIRPNLIQPSFLINPPVEAEPLAKRLEGDPTLVERFQIMACGTELGKGFSELNDPVDQRKRFEEQMRLRKKGQKDAQRLDEDFLKALEYGMPPTAGFGMSERLFSILVDKPIRETVIFPLLKSKPY